MHSKFEEISDKWRGLEQKSRELKKENEYYKAIEEAEGDIERKELEEKEVDKEVIVEKAIKDLKELARIGIDHDIVPIKVIQHSQYLPIEQIKIYEGRYNDLNEKYFKTLEELQKIKVINIGEEQLLKERDSRIIKINEELIQLRGSFWYFILLDIHRLLEDQYATTLIDKNMFKEEWETKAKEIERY